MTFSSLKTVSNSSLNFLATNLSTAVKIILKLNGKSTNGKSQVNQSNIFLLNTLLVQSLLEKPK